MTTALLPTTPPHRSVPGLLTRLAWYALGGSACLIGALSMRYLLPEVPHPIGGTNLLLRRPWLVTHAVSASIALVSGPWQFRKTQEGRRPNWHRWNGRVYVAAVVVGWVSSIPIALHSQGGPVAHAGFLALGASWIFTTALALKAILQGDVPRHRIWMVRSYALSAAAITLRIMIPLGMATHVPFNKAYAFIAWACWLVNLVAVETFRVLQGRPSTTSSGNF